MIRPALRIAFEIAAVAALLAAGGIAWAVWSLAGGPMSIGWVNPVIEDGLNEAASPYRVTFADTIIEWTGEGGGIRIVGVQIADPAGRTVIAAPKAEIALSWRALLAGAFAPSRVVLFGPETQLIRHEDRSITLGQVAPGGGDAGMLDALLEEFDSGAGNGAGRYLDAFEIRDAALTLEDRLSGTIWSAPHASLALRRVGSDVAISLDADIETGTAPWRLMATLRWASGSDTMTLEAQMRDLRPASLAGLQDLRALAGADLPVSGDATITFGRDGRMRMVSLWLGARPGSVRIEGVGGDPVPVERAELSARFDVPARVLWIDGLSFAAGGVEGSLDGEAAFTLAEDGAIEDVRFDLTAQPVTLDLPHLFDAPVSYDRVALRGRADPRSGALAVERLALAVGDYRALFAGEIRDAPVSPEIRVDGTIENLLVPELVRLWPKPVALGARDWIALNMPEGIITGGSIKVALEPGDLEREVLPEDRVAVSFDARNMTVNYLSGLTMVTGASGGGTLTGNTFKARLDSGRIGALEVARGTATITGLHLAGPPGAFAADIRGKVSDMLALIDMEPLGFMKAYGVDPDEVGGTAALRVAVEMPLLRDIALDDITFDVRGKTDDLAIALDDERRLTGADLTLALDSKHLDAEGPACVGEVPVQLRWTELFEGGGAMPSTIVLSTTADQAQREALGLPEIPRVEGPAVIAATLRGRGKTLKRIEGSADLTPATISVPELNWTKPPGAAARAMGVIDLGPDGSVSVEQLVVEGSGMAIRGALTADDEGIVALQFPSVRLGPLNQLSLSLRREAGYLMATVDAERLDGTMLLDTVLGAGREQTAEPGARGATPAAPAPAAERAVDEPGPAFDLTARAKRVVIDREAAVQGAVLNLRNDGRVATQMALTGKFERGGVLDVAIAPAAGGRTLKARSDAAGIVVRGVTGFASMAGGRLALDASMGPGPDDPIAGTVRIDEFRLINQPFVARFLAAASVTGLPDLLAGQGIAFTALTSGFRIRNGVLTVEDAAMSGPSLGLTLLGTADLERRTIDMGGTLAPLFLLNSMLGNIPLVGDLFVSRPGEGVVGITYALSGVLDEPSITVNPLSAFTPGIFRRLMEIGGAEPEEAQREDFRPRLGEPTR